jgi:hypothetical protein
MLTIQFCFLLIVHLFTIMKTKGAIILAMFIGLFLLNHLHSNASNPVCTTPPACFQITNNNNFIVSSNKQNTINALDDDLLYDDDDDVNASSRKRTSLENGVYCSTSPSHLGGFQNTKPSRVSYCTYFPHLSHSYFISLQVFRL